MKKTAIALATGLALSLSMTAKADPLAKQFDHYKAELEKAEKSMGHMGPKAYIPEPVKVTDGIYTVVGSMIWHNPSNYGLNNNLSWMEFEDGVMVFNAGANTALAEAFHEIIKKHTNKPVKWLVVENHQGHAHLGSSYWYDKGVRNLYSHSRAHADFKNHWQEIKDRWSAAVGYSITASSRDVSDKFTTFDDRMEVDVGGGEKVELFYNGAGHTPGATIAYVPSRNVIFTGDLAYKDRLLALFSYTSTIEWMKTFERFMETTPSDVIIVPGHGGPTNMADVKADTYDYLKFLHTEVQKVIDNGGDEAAAEAIDQSAYKDRYVYEQTHVGNARHVYRELTGQHIVE